MNIGLYFGSFNPIHIGHLIIADFVANNSEVDKVWFVVSPQNPLKESSTLLEESLRLNLVNKAIENNPKFETCDIEFNLPRPSYTIDTLAFLKNKFPTFTFSIIMGSDSFVSIYKWKNYERLLQENFFIIYERTGFPIKRKDNNVIILNAPLLNISSTAIRTSIKEGKSIRYLVVENVLQELHEKGYYK